MSSGAAPERCVLRDSGAGEMVLAVQGRWNLDTALPAVDPFVEVLAKAPALARLTVVGAALGDWDGTLIAFLLPVLDRARKRNAALAFEQLPPGLTRLIALADAVPDRTEASQAVPRASLRERARAARKQAEAVVAFIGEMCLALTAIVRRREPFPMRDFLVQVELCGVQALPIISVTSFLVGLIIAFVGLLPLRQFGASIYVVNLVGLATAREMAPIMTAVVLAGRTGAAFAAELGAMRSNEEVDALDVLGISSYAYLAMPRLLALTVMLPVLCIYADLLGLLGGFVVAHGMAGISGQGFMTQLTKSVPFLQFVIGFAKSWVFGIIIGTAGCYQGLNSGRSAADVGAATTKAVVASILAMIIADGAFAVVLQAIGV